MPRILVLDDEKLIRWSLKQILSQEGYDVDTAETKDEALKLASSRSYGLIFTDLEVCGDQAKAFYTQLLAGQERAKIIVLTALTKEQAEQTLGDFRTFLILEKPFISENIKEVAEKALSLVRKDLDR
jgi:two-component system, sporulation sensor kinase A